MDVLDWILVAIRWIHALAAVAWVGGGIFYVLVLRPSRKQAGDGDSRERDATAQEFRSLVNTAIGVLLLTGVILSVSRLTASAATIPYMAVLAVKIVLAHAVLALNKEDGLDRRFILVECEDYADTLTAERVRRVINGIPGARDKSLQEGMGGSFTYCTLGEPIDVEEMLSGEALPSYSALAAYPLHTASGISAGTASLESQNEDGLFYTNGSTDYYLLYKPDLDWLSGNEGILNEERAREASAPPVVERRRRLSSSGRASS